MRERKGNQDPAGASIPQVLQKTCGSSSEIEYEGGGRLKREGQVKQGQCSSPAESYEG